MTRPFHQRGTRVFTSADEMFVGLLDQIGLLSCQVAARIVSASWDYRLTLSLVADTCSSFDDAHDVTRTTLALPRRQVRGLARRQRLIYRARPAWPAAHGCVEGYERVATAIFSRERDVSAIVGRGGPFARAPSHCAEPWAGRRGGIRARRWRFASGITRGFISSG